MTEKKLKTLEEHNELVEWGNRGGAVPNGIACPMCGNELMDSVPGVVLASYPPQFNIYCPVCNFHGYRR